MGMASINYSGVAAWANTHWSNGGNDGFQVDDCTDFASRAIAFGGGAPEKIYTSGKYPARTDSLNYWFYWSFFGELRAWSNSWSVAAALAALLWSKGSKFLPHWSQARPGDIVFGTRQGPHFDKIGHTGVVYAMKNGMPQIAQHSRNVEEPLSNWPKRGENAIWIARPNIYW
jgi:hypothetical protein